MKNVELPSFSDKMRGMNNNHYLVPGLIVLSVAVPGLVSHVFKYIQYLRLRKNGVSTKGLVRDLIYDDDEGLSPRMRIEYFGENGTSHFMESSTGSAFYRGLDGKEIDLIYEMGNAEKAFIIMEIKKTNTIIAFIYLIMVFVGLYLVLSFFDVI